MNHRQEESDARNDRLTAIIHELASLISEALRIEGEEQQAAREARAQPPATAPREYEVGDRVRITNRVVLIPPPSDRSQQYNVGTVVKLTAKRIHIRLDHVNRIVVRHPSNVARLT